MAKGIKKEPSPWVAQLIIDDKASLIGFLSKIFFTVKQGNKSTGGLWLLIKLLVVLRWQNQEVNTTASLIIIAALPWKPESVFRRQESCWRELCRVHPRVPDGSSGTGGSRHQIPAGSARRRSWPWLGSPCPRRSSGLRCSSGRCQSIGWIWRGSGLRRKFKK